MQGQDRGNSQDHGPEVLRFLEREWLVIVPIGLP
jgi:hypothetical protein